MKTIESLYYYTTGDQEVAGPVDLKEIHDLINLGELQPSVQVCRNGSKEWKQFRHSGFTCQSCGTFLTWDNRERHGLCTTCHNKNITAQEKYHAAIHHKQRSSLPLEKFLFILSWVIVATFITAICIGLEKDREFGAYQVTLLLATMSLTAPLPMATAWALRYLREIARKE